MGVEAIFTGLLHSGVGVGWGMGLFRSIAFEYLHKKQTSLLLPHVGYYDNENFFH